MNYLHELHEISLQLKHITKRVDEILKAANEKVPEPYPHKGTWKDKIIFVLDHIQSPLTAKEVAEWIFRIDKIEYDPKAESSIIQICSNLSRNTPPELIAEGNYNKKYSIPKND